MDIADSAALKPDAAPVATPAPLPPVAASTDEAQAALLASLPAAPSLAPSEQPGMLPPEAPGAMTPRPWHGFWHAVGDAIARRFGVVAGDGAFAEADPLAEADWRPAATRRRRVLLSLVLLSTLVATTVFVVLTGVAETARPLQLVETALYALLFAWVAAGFWTACIGYRALRRGDRWALRVRELKTHAVSPDARTALVMPICNEDVETVFAGLAATFESLAATRDAALFDLFVLSDSSDAACRDQEIDAWKRLSATFGEGRVFYRWRIYRTERKAGNIAEFCRRWGGAYRYMVVLDADSVMSGEALGTLLRAIESRPRAGIVQAPTRVCGAETLHARAQQFAARTLGPVFAAGMQFWQLGESHYFGHNAIIRIAPFMRHCSLASLHGSGALSGHIMSHDFIEAALMRRGGWEVWSLPDIPGSYEQNPPDITSELQRDRRWCQGNLQNSRLIAEPGICGAHRAMLLTGTMSYLSAPLWMAFIAVGLLSTFGSTDLPYGYASGLFWLWFATIGMLMLPRALGVMAILQKGDQRFFGGAARLVGGSVLEAVVSIMQAPLRMVTHTLFVLAPLLGLDSGWTSPPRVANGIAWRPAIQHQGMLALLAGLGWVNLYTISPTAAFWITPLTLPLVLTVPMSVYTSRASIGLAMRCRGWIMVPEEGWMPAVLRHAQRGVARVAAVFGPRRTRLAARWGQAALARRRS